MIDMTPHWTLAPQLRGRIAPHALASLRAAGWSVHVIGQAAYIHDGSHHYLMGVWGCRADPPRWAARLGRPSDGYLRREARCAREQKARLMLRDELGRFRVRLPWWRVPGPVVYTWLPPRPSLVDAERELEAESRARARARGWVA